MDMVVKRFEIYFVDLDPTIGSEIKKIRPCLVISSDDVNRMLNTVIVAPITSTIKNYPTRINCVIENRNGQAALDQLRAVDKARLGRSAGKLDRKTSDLVLYTLQEMFK
ncbi:MAG: transcriptional modulator of MazE/toxin, MazF [Daejeonella sp.]|nr:transcriptional modulator of MazE/toxin, MazF [Daejeonella sp.]